MTLTYIIVLQLPATFEQYPTQTQIHKNREAGRSTSSSQSSNKAQRQNSDTYCRLKVAPRRNALEKPRNECMKFHVVTVKKHASGRRTGESVRKNKHASAVAKQERTSSLAQRSPMTEQLIAFEDTRSVAKC
ncbi:hypothetical protein Trydic_g7464 [Trypoxylus dichotomus]